MTSFAIKTYRRFRRLTRLVFPIVIVNVANPYVWYLDKLFSLTSIPPVHYEERIQSRAFILLDACTVTIELFLYGSFTDHVT
jgi:hypothetical protein